MIHSNDRVLFIGDSVTNAFRMPDEVSSAYQLGAGYALMVAGHYYLTRAGDGIEFFNRGVSGDGVRQLEARWEEDCLALKPTVVSVLVGVNETLRRFLHGGDLSLDEYETVLKDLLARTQAALSGVRLIVCEPFLLLTDRVTPEWMADIAKCGAVARRVAAEVGAVFVPLQQPFAEACAVAPPDYWAFDGIHPNAAGFALIAREWIKAVERA
jgi:acyl-CoA thioesterase-1